MTAELRFLADAAARRAEQARHTLDSRYDDYLEFDRTKRVGHNRFRTLTERIRETGAPYGAHTIVYRQSGELLLVRHDGVDLWVLPGGGVRADETFREAAARELREEAGVEVHYDGLAMVTEVQLTCGETETWGVLPVFAAEAETTEPDVSDPDDEISEARWFSQPPADTRDRADILAWRDRVLSA